MQWRRVAAIMACIALAACSVSNSQEGSPVAATIRLTSPAFAEGGQIPEKYTCDGDDVTPPLAWTDVPDGVASFALIVTDPDAGGFVHWVLTDIPADLRELPEGQGDVMGLPGRNDFGRSGWGGPCPPSGSHRYVFTLYALSEPFEHGSGVPLTADALLQAIGDTTAGVGSLTGTYARR